MLIDVHFRWSDEHGPCYDCGLPSAFLRDPRNRPQDRLCAVCAANAACDDELITRIDVEPMACRICGRTDLPLHIDYACAECSPHASDPETGE